MPGFTQYRIFRDNRQDVLQVFESILRKILRGREEFVPGFAQHSVFGKNVQGVL